MLRPAVAETKRAKEAARAGRTSRLDIGREVPVDELVNNGASREARPVSQRARPGGGRQRAGRLRNIRGGTPIRWTNGLDILSRFCPRKCENPDKSSLFPRISGMRAADATSTALQRLIR